MNVTDLLINSRVVCLIWKKKKHLGIKSLNRTVADRLDVILKVLKQLIYHMVGKVEDSKKCAMDKKTIFL